MERIRWERLAAILICGAFGAVFGYFLLRTVIPLLLPFLIAFAISLLVRPAARGLEKKMGGSAKLWSALLLTALLLVIGVGLWWGIRRLWGELYDLAQRLIEERGGAEELMADAAAVMEQMRKSIFGFLPDEGSTLQAKAEELVNSFIEKAITEITERLPSVMGRILSALPNLFLVLFMTVLAGFYFCFDGERIVQSVKELLPTSLKRRFAIWGAHMKRISFRYLRAYLYLLLLTVGELFIGFCVLRVRYAFLLAIGIAILDMLPILGVGTVLIPWAVIALLQKNFYLGFGLLILYAAVALLRQISEPRLIGKSLGVHPLLTLFATYVGFRCFGFLGMLLAPFAALLVKTLILQLRPLEKGKTG